MDQLDDNDFFGAIDTGIGDEVETVESNLEESAKEAEVVTSVQSAESTEIIDNTKSINLTFNTKSLQEIIAILFLGTETTAICAEKSKMIFFKTIEKELYIYTSSQNITICKHFGEITDQLNVCFDAKKLKHIVDKTTKETVTFIKEPDQEQWTIKGNGKYSLQNFIFDIPIDTLLVEIKKATVTIAAEEFAGAMSKSVFFVNEERQDPHLRNFYFDGNMVATDRKSIQVVKTSLTGTKIQPILIPQIFYDVCQKLKSTLEIYEKDNYFIVSCNNYLIELPLIAGVEKFPDYNNFIKGPELYQNKLEINRKEFLECLERATFFANKKEYFGIEIHIELTKVTVKVDWDDKVEESVACTATIEKKIGLNGQYLKKALEVFEDDSITVMYNEPHEVIYLKDKYSRLILVPVLI